MFEDLEDIDQLGIGILRSDVKSDDLALGGLDSISLAGESCSKM